MVGNWADAIADRIVAAGPPLKGKLLLLGAADTGKTTLMSALADRLVPKQPVALVDADTGQSHIGPPTTVGWTVIDPATRVNPAPPPFSAETAELAARGIAFVGDITPVGHLLQLTAALMLCVEQAEQAADVILIDTPGLVTGGAACSLWWTIQRLLRPERIIAIQRENELGDVLAGLQAGFSVVEMVKAPPELRRKSPEARQQHRRRLFDRYFQNASACTLDLDNVSVRATRRMTPDDSAGRIIGLTDVTGQDVAIGVIERWPPKRGKVTIRVPRLDIRRVRCLTIGDTKIDISFGWS
jgi:polynucleotide 5'-hydroxyl-kinase GRC3/NOL9